MDGNRMYESSACARTALPCKRLSWLPSRRLIRRAVVSLSLLILIAAGVGAGAYSHLQDNVRVLDVENKMGSKRPVKYVREARNILVVGSDTRKGANSKYGHTLEGMQSDTLMIIHIAANREWAAIVSIPRDSYVSIPACDRGDGTHSAPLRFKINAAYAIGGSRGDVGGAVACTMRTIEANTGLRMDHFAVVDFQGFKSMVNSLGGIKICLEEEINDTNARVHLDAGCQTVEDEKALGYVRARYSIGNGSDTERIVRQQEFMKALADQVEQKLTSPRALYGFLDAVTDSLTLDKELADVTLLHDIVVSLRTIPRRRISFVTVPNYPRELDVPTDKANVVWRYPQAQTLFSSLIADREVNFEGLKLAK